MENAIEKVNVAQELSENSTSIACSLKGGTRKEKAEIYNALNNPKHKVGDYINKKIAIKNYLCEQIVLADEETGEPVEQIRTVLIDDKGESYQAVSVGVFNALKKLIAVFGAAPWDEPLTVVVKQISTKAGSMLTLDMAE